MEHLPWLIVYGGVVWRVALGLLIVSVILISLGRVRLRARRRRARALAWLGAPVPLESVQEGELVTLSGTLGFRGKPAKRFEDGKPVVAVTAAPEEPAEVLGALSITRCAEDLFLQVGGEEVGIDSSLEVIAGSLERITGRRFRQLGSPLIHMFHQIDDAASSTLSTYRVAFRSLSSGDTVRVRGILRRMAAPQKSEGYRAAADRWVLSSEAEHDAEETGEGTVAAAFEGRPRASGPWLRVLFFREIIALVVAAAAVAVLGQSLRWTPDLWRSGPRDVFGQGAGFCVNQPITENEQIQGALPLFRLHMLASLVWHLQNDCDWSRESLLQLAEVEQLLDNQGRAALFLALHGEADRAQEVLGSTEEPGDPLDAGLAWLALGQFDAASEAFERLEDNEGAAEGEAVLTAHILAGSWTSAAATARKMGRHSLVPLDASELDQVRYREASSRWECLALTLEARGGIEGAADSLREQALAPESSDWCALFVADTIDGPERLALIRRRTERPRRRDELRATRWGEERYRTLLEAEIDPTVVLGESALHDAPDRLFGWGRVFPIFNGLERSALENMLTERDPARRSHISIAELQTRALQLEIATGNVSAGPELAEAALAELEALPPEEATTLVHSVFMFARGRVVAAEILAGQTKVARTRLAGLRAAQEEAPLISQTSAEHLEAMLDWIERRETKGFTDTSYEGLDESIWEEAVTGDVSSTANLIREFQKQSQGPTSLPLWAMHLESGRAELIEVLRWSWVLNSDEGRINNLDDTLSQMSRQLILARALNDEEWAGQVEPVLRRLYDARMRRDVALLLAAAQP
jgi:hypothetical protein